MRAKGALFIFMSEKRLLPLFVISIQFQTRDGSFVDKHLQKIKALWVP